MPVPVRLQGQKMNEVILNLSQSANVTLFFVNLASGIFDTELDSS